MRKVLLVSALALAVAGCATSSETTPEVPVRDLSASRDQSAASTYTVVSGDTLYGIAWRHDMDYRDLAKLNDIRPPYRIQPGQQLALKGGGERDTARATGTARAEASAAVATPLGADDAATDDTSWLQPNEAAIERNRRLEAGPVTESGSSPAAPASEPATNVATVGPIYSYDSPGADGSLSERDRAERRALEAQWGEPEGPSGEREEAETTDSSETAEAESEATAAPSESAQAPATPSSSPQPEPAPKVDAGTSVAGEPEAERRSSRRYTPVTEIAWQWPVEGDLIGDFGAGEGITAGIDIAGQKGQSVKAAGPGIVVYAGNGVRGYGNLVLLKHNDQFLSAYAHNDSLKVQENDVVEAGEVIATMGDSDAETIRLHFEVRKDGQPQNPLDFLPQR